MGCVSLIKEGWCCRGRSIVPTGVIFRACLYRIYGRAKLLVGAACLFINSTANASFLRRGSLQLGSCEKIVGNKVSKEKYVYKLQYALESCFVLPASGFV